MKAQIKKQEEFTPITIEIVLETFQETEDFYRAIGSMKAIYPTDKIYRELAKMHPDLNN